MVTMEKYWQLQLEKMERAVETEKTDLTWGQQDQQRQWDVKQQHMKNLNDKHQKEWLLEGREIYEAKYLTEKFERS